jgi:2-polyprenyl-3-methyl-5-hydroxy-6-metoxy-1,4-benzoquinol methylase
MTSTVNREWRDKAWPVYLAAYLKAMEKGKTHQVCLFEAAKAALAVV